MRNQRKKYLFLIVLILVALVFAFYLKKVSLANSKKFYAVFLTNDQVYFGHILKKNKRELILSEVYYLKANTTLSLSDDNVEESETTSTAKLSLVKLGKELHRPKDEIVINWQNVLLYQEMKGQGEIMEAINKYRSGKN